MSEVPRPAPRRKRAWPARTALVLAGVVVGFGLALLLAAVNWLLPLLPAVVAIFALPSVIAQGKRPEKLQWPWFAGAGLGGLIVGTGFWVWVMNAMAGAF